MKTKFKKKFLKMRKVKKNNIYIRSDLANILLRYFL